MIILIFVNNIIIIICPTILNKINNNNQKSKIIFNIIIQPMILTICNNFFLIFTFLQDFYKDFICFLFIQIKHQFSFSILFFIRFINNKRYTIKQQQQQQKKQEMGKGVWRKENTRNLFISSVWVDGG